MRIASSAVAMESDRQYVSFSERQSSTLETVGEQEAATLEVSEESKGLLRQINGSGQESREAQEAREKRAAQNFAERQREAAGARQETRAVKSPAEMKLEILKQLLDALKRMRGQKDMRGLGKIRQLEREYRRADRADRRQESYGADAGTPAGKRTGSVLPNVTKWTRTTVNSVFFTEAEHTAFQARGMARTADGREIEFGVTVEMSRAFCAEYEYLSQEKYFCTDPLVINLDGNAASVTDQKFLFDLDGDGKEENISFAGEGSGFLALDKNGDGKINDGNELFGTRSGNGFKDLAAYDKDGNGWIDENDSVFGDLKIWTKDAMGNDKLVSLKEADVGAIYLGYTDTEFSLNDGAANRTNGIVRSTGVFLKESGGAGTVQHVDLVV